MSESSGVADYARIVSSSDGTRVAAIWPRRIGSHDHLQTRGSSDGGATWGATTNLTPPSDGGSASGKLQIAMSANGNRITVIYPRGSSGIQVRSTSDGGANWGSTTDLSGSGPAEDPQLAMSSDGTRLTVVWRKGSSIQTRSSNDGGATWGSITNSHFSRICLKY